MIFDVEEKKMLIDIKQIVIKQIKKKFFYTLDVICFYEKNTKGAYIAIPHFIINCYKK